MFVFAVDSCFFKKSVPNLTKRNLPKKLQHCTTTMATRTDCMVCRTCLNYINKGATPPAALKNGLELDPVPEQLLGLTPLEERLVSARLPFMKIGELEVD